MRPRCKTYFEGVCPKDQPDGKCEGCDVFTDINGGGKICQFCDELTANDYFTTSEKIAALTDALKELGVDVVEKKLFDAMTREASKYQRLYGALLTMCAEQGFVPTLPKPKEETL